jgi:iron complex outermembrane receptor protein
MKKMMIAATMTAAATMALATAAIAQMSVPDQQTAAPAEPAAAEAAAPFDAPAPADAAAAAPVDVITLPDSQTAGTPQREQPRERGGLEEVIVTAQRREQSAQDVPVSITVIDAQQISNANITNSSDLATYTPSLSTNQRFGPESATFAIRGFTQDLRTTASVGVYFAEVVAPRGQSSQTSGDGAGPGELFDLENVQVLKGPQGTLFGRNTTGGAVLIVPKKPTDSYEGYLEASAGDYDLKRIQGVFNAPLLDNFKLRFGVDSNHRDGHLKNYTGIGADDLGNVNYTSGRLSALWDITDTVNNYTIFSYAYSKTHGSTSTLYQCNPSLQGNLFYVFVGRQCQQQLDDQKANGVGGFYDLASTIDTPLNLQKTMRAINTTTWAIDEDLHLKNIFSYAHLHTENGSDIFGTQFHYQLAGVPIDLNPDREFKIGISVPNPDEPVTSQETFVEELQLQGTSFGGAFEWTTGAYFEKSLPDGFSGNNSIALVSCNLASVEGQPSGYDCFDPLGGALGGLLAQQYKTTYLNRALYAEGTYSFTDQWSATLGGRYTWDHTEGYGIKTRYTYLLAAELPNSPNVAESSPEVSSKAPTGQVQVSYKPTKDIMTYAKYVRGYRQGNVILAADPGIDTFKPEHVNSYEIGSKTSFRGWIPGRFNVAAFYNDLTDMQLQYGYISTGSQTTTTIVNAGKARIGGVEVEAFLQPLPGLIWATSYSYLNTKLVKFDTDQPEVAAVAIAGTATPIAVQGDTLPFAPDHTVVTSLTYSLPIPVEIGNVDVGATYVYTGKRRSSATGSSPDDVLDPFELLNANINWTSIFMSRFDVSLFATNVLDEKYTTYGSGTYYTLGFDSRAVGLPRMLGARLRYSFGD